jgi:RimJ/RimL family protein N-acetyltransferase
MKFILETDRLRIRKFKDSDLESLFAYRNDPEVARYQGWDAPYPCEMAREFVEEMKAKDSAVRGEWFQAAIEEIVTGEMVGDYYSARLYRCCPFAARSNRKNGCARGRAPPRTTIFSGFFWNFAL